MLNLDPAQAAGALINQGVVAAQGLRLIEAVETFGAAITRAGADNALVGKALFNRGMVYASMGLAEKAQADFNRALLLPDVPLQEQANCHYARANLLAKQQQFDAAIVELLCCVDRLPHGHDLLGKVQHNLVACRQKRNAATKPLQVLTGCIKSAVMSKAKRAQAHFDRAMMVSALGDWQQALQDYDQVIKEPSVGPALTAMALNNRGVLSAARGQVKAAMQDYAAVLALEQVPAGVRGNALNNMGLVHLQLGDYDPAQAAFTQGLALPDVPPEVAGLLLSNRLKVWGMTGQVSAQSTHLDALIALPEVNPLHRHEAFNQRGLLRMAKGEGAAAMQDFEAVVKSAAPSGDQVSLAYNNMGVLAGGHQQHEQALIFFETAASIPDVAWQHLSNAIFNRGAAKERLGQIDSALLDYTQVIETPQSDPQALAKALVNRAAHWLDRDGNQSLAFADTQALLAIPNVPLDQVLKARTLRARLFALSGNHPQVLAEVQAGLGRADHAELRLLGFMACLWMGDWEQANTYFQHELSRPMSKEVSERLHKSLIEAKKAGLQSIWADEALARLPVAGSLKGARQGDSASS